MIVCSVLSSAVMISFKRIKTIDKLNAHNGKIIAKKNNNSSSNNQNNRNNKNNNSNGKNQKNDSNKNTIGKNKVKKINNLQAAAITTGNNSTSNRRLESYLISVKDPSIRRWLSKSCNSNSSNHNDTKLQHLSDKHHKKLATPARNRSSLDRPVRVQDSYLQRNKLVIDDWNNNEHIHNQEMQQKTQEELCLEDKSKYKYKDDKKKGHKQIHQVIDDLVEIRVNKAVKIWPIRFRLSEFFELTLPKYRRRKRKRCHCMMITTMRQKTIKSMIEVEGIRDNYHEGAFKDTERLLKVLSINNVDQENRYNVSRCSVM
ncbi:PREDICTED: putative uncharacterized protein DDB_G0282499 [Ceratosolen solmsi marchali]|uniref:Uncharacterized protein n=1 Tax=Ceratosolen solmsi marchali TaxID=326594 RepID=A0AAJ6YC72_9HYME|nr:PREDICTED: putative uncharacterized protein DDB_G0282499 [Ceratosolen solmsi marchali]